MKTIKIIDESGILDEADYTPVKPTSSNSKTPNQQNRHTKAKMIEALETTFGIVTDACKIVNINRSTHYDWYNKDLEYKASVDDVLNICLDYVESKLFELIGNGNVNATIFYLKMKGKSRGYIDIVDTSQDTEIRIIREIVSKAI